MDETALDGARRIRAVVAETGVSKELIHHYLRLGLLPASHERAHYDEQQVRLLRQIRTLREDHNLPLEVIRRLFALFDFEPARIEALTLTDSLGKRVTDLTERGELLSARTLDAAELVAESGTTAERLGECLQARLVEPLQENGEARYGSYDAKVLALCERGLELGIPFEAFRTIASYVRIAFELEHRVFYDLPQDGPVEADAILAELFVRREVATGFVQNVLTAQTQRKLRRLLEQPGLARVTLDDVVYRPSALFVRVHGLDELAERARERVRQAPAAPAARVRLVRLLLHAGRHEEGALVAGESLEKWPDHAELGLLFGRASLLAGETERGPAALARVAGAGGPHAPLASALLALGHFAQAHADDRAEALVRHAVPIARHVEHALAAPASDASADAIEARMLSGYLLTVLPPVFSHDGAGRGVAMLREALAAARTHTRGPRVADELPGMAERLQINAAHLALAALEQGAAPPDPRGRSARAHQAAAAPLPSRAELSALVCGLDPASAFAERAFLAAREPAPAPPPPRTKARPRRSP